MIFETIVIPLTFLIGSAVLTAHTCALHLLGRIQCKREFQKRPFFYFFFSLVERLFPKGKWDSLHYLLRCTRIAFYTLFAITSSYYALYIFDMRIEGLKASSAIAVTMIVVFIGLSVEFLLRLGTHFIPLPILRTSTPLAHIFLLSFFPFSFFFCKLHQLLLQRGNISHPFSNVKDTILELVDESQLSHLLDPPDLRLITSMASFRDRIVREIMVPRVDIFCLSVDQTVHEAAQKFLSEGYSRIPVYKKTMDHIEGVLLYKDVIEYYFMSIERKESSPLETPLKKLIKPVLYTPETKKISNLLQEIRQQQIHLAIVVDEYGGTEGIVTIEDILEELVGEIADEHDVVEEETVYRPHPAGGWVVDPKMTILDIEKKLGVAIPQSPEYETLGGFVLHKAGSIPDKGWKIHSDHFDLEVLDSSERSLEAIVLIPSKS